MEYDEFKGWLKYFEARPIGWREDQRTLALLKTWGFKGNEGDIFPSLKAIQEHQNKNKPVWHGIKHLLANSVGGVSGAELGMT